MVFDCLRWFWECSLVPALNSTRNPVKFLRWLTNESRGFNFEWNWGLLGGMRSFLVFHFVMWFFFEALSVKYFTVKQSTTIFKILIWLICRLSWRAFKGGVRCDLLSGNISHHWWVVKLKRTWTISNSVVEMHMNNFKKGVSSHNGPRPFNVCAMWPYVDKTDNAVL